MRSDNYYMNKALLLARRAGRDTLPNPAVGAVLVKGDRIVGEGFHKMYGSAHAEVEALRVAGDLAKGARLYVTLEPCNHIGKTPPCTESILGAGVGSVVYGMSDPNPSAAGGARELVDKGLEVYSIKSEIAAKQNSIWLHSLSSNRPFVILKIAASKDGKITAARGHETSISSKPSRIISHKLRRDCDAVLIGAETARVDDPLLTNRLAKGAQPVKIVLDSNLELDPGMKVFNSPSFVACTSLASAERKDKFLKAGVGVIVTPPESEFKRVRIDNLLLELKKLGIYSLLVEGGAQVARSFLNTNNVDRFFYFRSPKVFGGDGPSVFEEDSFEIQAFGLKLVQSRRSGVDNLDIYNREKCLVE